MILTILSENSFLVSLDAFEQITFEIRIPTEDSVL